MRWFAGSLGLALACVVFLNARVDVAGQNDGGSVRALAAGQTPRLVLAAQRQYDQRAWVEGRVLARCPNLLVTGSSTSGALSQLMFPEGELLNAWLTGPMIEDFEALSAFLEARHCRPETIIFGVDAFLFNAQVADQRWQSWRDYQLEFGHPTSAAQRMLGRARHAWVVLQDWLAFETTRDTLAYLWRGRGAPQESPLLVSDVEAYCRAARVEPALRYADGHYSGCRRFELGAADVEQLAATYLARNFHRMATFSTLDQGRLQRLGAVVARLRQSSRNVILFAPPYHPTTFAALAREPKLYALLAQLDRTLLRLASAAGAKYVVLRDPAELGCEATAFSDSHHTRAACSARIARRLSLLEAGATRAARR